MSQSYQYFGFSIKGKVISLWFGYFLALWKDYETPIFLQHKLDWAETGASDIEDILKKNGFKYDKEFHFIRPFDLGSIASWKDELAEILGKIPGVKNI